jgi:hypothetical protein
MCTQDDRVVSICYDIFFLNSNFICNNMIEPLTQFYIIYEFQCLVTSQLASQVN